MSYWKYMRKNSFIFDKNFRELIKMLCIGTFPMFTILFVTIAAVNYFGIEYIGWAYLSFPLTLIVTYLWVTYLEYR